MGYINPTAVIIRPAKNGWVVSQYHHGAGESADTLVFNSMRGMQDWLEEYYLDKNHEMSLNNS